MLLRYTKGDVVKTAHGLATVLGASWVTVCDGWHPDKRRIHEELRIMVNDGSIKCCYAQDVEGPIIRGAEM